MTADLARLEMAAYTLIRRLPSPVVGLVGAAFVVGVLDRGGTRLPGLFIALGLAAIIVAWAARHAGAALGVIIAFTPFQLVVLAWILKLGAPATAVRYAGYLKDAMVLGIGVAALLESKRVGARKFRTLDYAAMLYLIIASVYLLLPLAFHGSLGGQTWSVRLYAWRLDTLFVFLLLFCRRVRFDPRTIARVAGIAVVTGIAMFGSAMWETASKRSYSNFFAHTIDLPAYQELVLRTAPKFGYVTTTTIGGHSFVRDGGFFADNLVLGFFCVVPFALGVQWLIASRPRPYKFIPPVAIGVTVALTVTRSAILAAGVALLLIVGLSFKRRSPARLPALVILIAAMAAILPLTAHSAVGARFGSLFGSGASHDVDNQQHKQSTLTGLQDVIVNPAGKGLGANPSTGARFQTSNVTITENSYLQVGTELGAAGLVAFVLMYLALLRELWRRSRPAGLGGSLSVAMFAAGAGLFVGGLFLQVWTSFETALQFWGLAGAVLSLTEVSRRRAASGERHRELSIPSPAPAL